MHYVFRFWYSLVYSNAYLSINVVVIVLILCSDLVYSMSSFVFCQFYLIGALSCVICVICCYVYMFVYVICCAVLYYHCHRVDTQFGVKSNSIQFFIIYVPSQQPQGQLQTRHSTYIHNYIMDTQHKVQGKLQEHIIAEKQTNK
jgi:hypothetical protein